MNIIYYVASSLDGYIATTEGGVEWLDPFQDGKEDYGFVEFHNSVEILLLGSRTYEFALANPPWPSPQKKSWVFTRRELPIADPSVTLTKEDPATVVAFLKAQGIQSAWLMGGGTLAGSFQNQGLITEYIVSFMPLLLGEGIPLFAGFAELQTLKLIETTPYENGIVQLRYRVSGE